ncbi:uncharacterized protein KD926_004290 [Aspergillus affinis]|uniref:uncharacterized protein n=1 Tax=Aspergillus affinis TaxID=1070780 RepID=UPI0022FE8F95|nr:uncharacterized protein KD926_004290 [Aspergillus affinis]KAI9035206.1 hypothetical protein KD926_004290 [Aspergillus affinis]
MGSAASPNAGRSSTLLRTIFETQDIRLNLDEIAEAWPGDEKSTPKALSEQLHKYRKNGKGTNKITFTMASKRKADDSSAGTPRKKATPKKATPKKATPKKGGIKAEATEDEMVMRVPHFLDSYKPLDEKITFDDDTDDEADDGANSDEVVLSWAGREFFFSRMVYFLGFWE